MTTRRQFCQRAGALGVAAGGIPYISWGSQKRAASGAKIKSVIRREETTVRSGGFGGVAGATWTADDRQLVLVDEGIDWPNLLDAQFQGALIEVAGAPQNATFKGIEGFPVLSLHDFYRPEGDPAYYPNGILAIDQNVYVYISSFHGTEYYKAGTPPSLQLPDLKCTKLIYSTDNGRTWRNQDGGQPVYYEQPKDQTRQSMIFWDEPRGLFDGVNLLQMGRGYRDNVDGYVYGYSQTSRDGAVDVAMYRVSRTHILHRDKYEFFAGLRADGSATWTKDIASWAPVHSFPRDWGMGCVVYNAPLSRYMMTANTMKITDGMNDKAAPSTLGLWVASQPWGRWQQIYQESPWRPAGQDVFCWGTNIPSKWIARDGKSFWMTWTDWRRTAPLPADTGYEKLWFAPNNRAYTELVHKQFTAHGNFRFNRQRIDLVLA